MTELEVRWPSADYARLAIGTPLDVAEVAGMPEGELASLFDAVPGYSGLSARSSSQGKGASGPAFAIIVEIERWATDAATLLALGTALVHMIKRLRTRGRENAVVEDLNALGAIALAENQSQAPLDEQEMKELRYMSTVPITATLGMGTNGSDIWAVCFKAKSYDAVVVFISPMGTWLGRVRVPSEYHWDAEHVARQRSPEEIRGWWCQP